VCVHGTISYIWHDGGDRYDEVEWHPERVCRAEAYEIALRKLANDQRATKIHVDYGDTAFVEASRPRSDVQVA
jgi:hypothetical protein